MTQSADDVLGVELANKMRRFVELRDKRDELDVAKKKAEKEYREFEAELWDLLDESPVEGALKLNLGEPHGVVTFQPKETYYGKIIDEDAAHEYIEQTAQVEEFTKPEFVKARVSELIRNKLDAGESIPKGFDFTARRYISISRPK